MKLGAIGRKWTYWYGTEQGYQQVQLPLCKTFRSGASPTSKLRKTTIFGAKFTAQYLFW
jgi:hypothetical protein